MHVEGWIVGLRAKGLAESTVRSAYTILRAILDTAVRDGALARNPAAAVKRPKVTAKESVFLTPEQSVKTAKSKRSISVSDETGRLLKEIRKHQLEDQLKAGSQWHQSGYVFTTEDGQPCDPRNALRALKAAATKTGMTGIGLHTLRHSAATAMLTNGVPLKVVSEILGHASIAITADIYGHVSPDVSHEAMATLSTSLLA
jgi:site-specific recombinase XerD